MPNEFRYLRFGLVDSSFNDKELEVTERILRSYLRTAASMNMDNHVESAMEVFTLAKQYIGKDFSAWCSANYRNGGGARASLIKIIKLWIAGEVSGKLVISEIKKDVNRIEFLENDEEVLDPAIIYNDREFSNVSLKFNDVTDAHFFGLLALLGPELTAIFLLSLNGINYKRTSK